MGHFLVYLVDRGAFVAPESRRVGRYSPARIPTKAW